ncbi:hypothetical protein [Nitrosopumilus sp.]|uniref:hypothetical protein n=1 Tax=Nitrosopumilus sp. TaxID=2024843 RepID=UPI002630670C|nr:hypothetical protein [Nitrosopumilus sp.]
MKHRNTRFSKQTSVGDYFKIVFIASLILMIASMLIAMVEENSKSPVDRPQIRVNSEESASELSILQMISPAYAQTDYVHTYDTSIKSYETVFVSGAMDVRADHKPATMSLIGPQGEIIYAIPTELDEKGQFKWLLHPPAGGFEIGINKIIMSHPDLELELLTAFEVTEEVQLASEMSRKI